MPDLSSEGTEEPVVNPYRRNRDSGPQYGTRTTCELCRNTTVCYEEYGLMVCPDCQSDLLPKKPVL
ncbi:MAG: hypothetical protein ABEJ05_00500 [Haloglomus sp.]